MQDATLTRPFSANSFNQFLAEHKLMASRCLVCGQCHIPPRPICPNCLGENLEWVETSGRGRLAGFTVVYIAPPFMVKQGFGRENPYVTGIVELDDEPGQGSTPLRVSSRISGVDPSHLENIQIGMPLVVDFVDFSESGTEQSTTYLAFRPAG